MTYLRTKIQVQPLYLRHYPTSFQSFVSSLSLFFYFPSVYILIFFHISPLLFSLFLFLHSRLRIHSFIEIFSCSSFSFFFNVFFLFRFLRLCNLFIPTVTKFSVGLLGRRALHFVYSNFSFAFVGVSTNHEHKDVTMWGWNGG